MPTPTKGPRLGGSSAHQRHILSNLATALFEHGRITTTEAKARRLRPVAERLITFAKRGDLHARRQVLTVVNDKGVVHSLFTEIGPGFAERAGGYTRITKIGPRKGDNAPMAVIELVRDEVTARPRRRSRRSRDEAPAAAPATEATETAGDTLTAEDGTESPAASAGEAGTVQAEDGTAVAASAEDEESADEESADEESVNQEPAEPTSADGGEPA